jgi:Asp-tRNA(Asn)/Glu-tRNA(Gln) amidotransferase A subunit family amidase
MTDLAYLSAAEALERFADRSLSPVELLDAIIARAEATEPIVNALCFTRFDEARDEAKAAEARWLGKGAPPRQLEGIVTAIKDETAVAGQPCSMGSVIYKDVIADATSPFAQRMFDAGAIQHARTTTPEFSCAGFTHSRIHGVTRNPWNPDFGVGGSSGGSGASLAAGTSTLAAGSDIGGSIRIPASFNGVVGFKAPYGRVPVEPPFNLDSYCHNGGLARTVEDMRLFQNVLAGPHPMDHRSLRPKVEIPPGLGDVRGMRLAMTLDFGSYPLDPEIERNTRDAAEALRNAGAIVDEVEIGLTREVLHMAIGTHFAAIFGAWIGGLLDEHKDEMTGHAIAFVDYVNRMAGEDLNVYAGLDAETQIWNALAPVFESHDALLCPTVGMRGLVAGDDYADHGLEIGGQECAFYFDGIITPVFNIASSCPVLNVPSGFSDNGIPTGLQIVGRTYDDATTFAIGAALERERPWLDTPSSRPHLA